MKLYLCLFLIIINCGTLCISLEPHSCLNFFKKNKTKLLQTKFIINHDVVYVVGCSKKIGSEDATFEMAELDAVAQLINLKKSKVNFKNSQIKFGNVLKSSIFNNWLTFHSIEYTAINRIDIQNFIQAGYAYWVAAYKIDDVIFSDKQELTWDKIYTDFLNHPNERNALIFYEIIPAEDLQSFSRINKMHIAKQYGENFALMFMGEKLTVSKKQYEANLLKYADLDSNTELNILIQAANALPYNKQICILLQKRFHKLQMPRCANIMKLRTEKTNNLEIIDDSSVPSVNNITLEKQNIQERTDDTRDINFLNYL